MQFRNNNYYGKITKYALGSRIFIILLQYFGNILIPDHEAGVFIHPQIKDNFSIIDKTIYHLLGGFVRWDAQYFMHIAKYGYTYENTLAFFPLYPLIVRLFSLSIRLVFPWMNLDSVFLLVFIALNMILFLFSARTLFKLTTIIFDERTAYISVLLFCFNPASIFFSAPYTECLFFNLTLLSILNCIELYKKYYNSFKINYRDITFILPICLSTVVRSNGLLNIGFLIYTCLCMCKRHWPNTLVRKIKCLLKSVLATCVLIIICLIPFSIYQMYCYYMFCTNREFQFSSSIIAQAKEEGYVLPGQFFKNNQSWCHDKIPLAYSYVQTHYWNVGFLKYYELKQIPNFLLAAPILTILLNKSCQYLMYNFSRNLFDIFSFDKLFNKSKPTNIISNPILNVFVIHILFLSVFCILCVHVQVSTRMLCSASPILYWFCASSFQSSKVTITDKYYSNMSPEEYGLALYFLSYFILGTVLFCNFLPWT